jgi:SPP1 family predicted phage head-tail adaptor
MRAGKLDRVIVLQRSTYEPDEFGSPVYSWTDLATLRAEIVQASTEEFMRAFGANDETATIFRTRYVDGITTADRVTYRGVVHNIKELKELGRREGLEIRAFSSGAS